MTCRNSRKPLTCSSTTDTVLLSAQSPGGETIFLLKLHRKVLVTHAKVPSRTHAARGSSRWGRCKWALWETPVVQLLDDPAVRCGLGAWCISSKVSRVTRAKRDEIKLPKDIEVEWTWMSWYLQCRCWLRTDANVTWYRWHTLKFRAIYSRMVHFCACDAQKRRNRTHASFIRSCAKKGEAWTHTGQIGLEAQIGAAAAVRC